MPYVAVEIIKGRTEEQKQKVAQAITDALVEHMDTSAEHVYVVFRDVAATDWLIAGETVAERRRKRGET
jgi:4-oxalocrotonate tautomerase